MLRFNRRLSLLLLLAVLVSAMTVSIKTSHADIPNASDVFRRKIKTHRIRHFGYYTEWKHRRGLLGDPTTDETDTKATATGSSGTSMRFERGFIFWIGPKGIDGKGKKGNQIFSVHGVIFTKYDELASAHGVLGFPQAEQFTVNAQGDKAQLFERGMITWNAVTGAIFVDYDAR